MGKKHDNDNDYERKIAIIEIRAKVNRAYELGNDTIEVTPTQWFWLMTEDQTCVALNEPVCKYEGMWVYKPMNVIEAVT